MIGYLLTVVFFTLLGWFAHDLYGAWQENHREDKGFKVYNRRTRLFR